MQIQIKFWIVIYFYFYFGNFKINRGEMIKESSSSESTPTHGGRVRHRKRSSHEVGKFFCVGFMLF